MATDETPPRENVQMAENVLLSIEPQHAEAILDGEKVYEYRRVAPARDPPYRLVLYASAPVKAVVGVAWCFTKKSGKPETVITNTVVHTPHDPEDILDYFGGVSEGHALRLAEYSRFEDPVPLSDLREAGINPPQNFRYLGEVPCRPHSHRPDEVVVP